MADPRYSPAPPPPVHPVRVSAPPPEAPPSACQRARRLLWVLLGLALALMVACPMALISARFWPASPATRTRICELLNACPDFHHVLTEHDLATSSDDGQLPRGEDGRLVVHREWPWSSTYCGLWVFRPEDGGPTVKIAFRVDLPRRRVTFHPAHA